MYTKCCISSTKEKSLHKFTLIDMRMLKIRMNTSAVYLICKPYLIRISITRISKPHA